MRAYILNLEHSYWIFWILSLSVIYIFNLFKKIFLGDSGSFSLAFIFGVLLIKFYSLSENVSPFFIISILWYPSYELLFSIIRKKIQKKSPLKADTKHLHQLLLLNLSSYGSFFNKKYLNSISATLLNFYNFLVIYYSFTEINNSIFQIYLICFNLLIYSFVYYFLFKKK